MNKYNFKTNAFGGQLTVQTNSLLDIIRVQHQTNQLDTTQVGETLRKEVLAGSIDKNEAISFAAEIGLDDIAGILLAENEAAYHAGGGSALRKSMVSLFEQAQEYRSEAFRKKNVLLPSICPVDGYPLSFSAREAQGYTFYEALSTGPTRFKIGMGQPKDDEKPLFLRMDARTDNNGHTAGGWAWYDRDIGADRSVIVRTKLDDADQYGTEVLIIENLPDEFPPDRLEYLRNKYAVAPPHIASIFIPGGGGSYTPPPQQTPTSPAAPAAVPQAPAAPAAPTAQPQAPTAPAGITPEEAKKRSDAVVTTWANTANIEPTMAAIIIGDRLGETIPTMEALTPDQVKRFASSFGIKDPAEAMQSTKITGLIQELFKQKGHPASEIGDEFPPLPF